MIRKIAFDALKKVIIDKQYANMVLKNINHENMSLITSFVYGTLQHYDYCTYQWKHLLFSPVKKEIEILLNLATYQWLYIDKTPDYAVVNETTKIASKLFDGRYKSLVNAILRKMIKQQPKQLSDSDDNKQLSIYYSFPTWLLNLWEKQYSREDMLAFAQASNQAPTLYCKLNTLKTNTLPSDLPFKETDVVGCYQATSDLLKHPSFIHKDLIIQDKSAQAVGHFIPIQAHQRVLDACAAPGGKSVSMAIKTNNTSEIIAVDVHPHRVKLIEQLVHQANASCIVPVVDDVINYAKQQPEQSFDGVLVDAPCSGLGVLKRKPEIKMFIQPEDIDALVALQQAILASVAPLVLVDGWLVYATCTINKKENEKQAQWFLETYPNYIKEEERFIHPLTSQADGFYMVKFRRIR